MPIIYNQGFVCVFILAINTPAIPFIIASSTKLKVQSGPITIRGWLFELYQRQYMFPNLDGLGSFSKFCLQSSMKSRRLACWEVVVEVNLDSSVGPDFN